MVFWDVSMFWGALSAAGAVGAAGGVFYGFIQTRATLKETKYEKYVERYQEIYRDLPYGILSKNDVDTDLGPDVKKHVVPYVDLCAEELFDRQRGKIDGVVWRDWARLISDGLRCPRPRAVLEENKSNYPNLYEFVKTGKVPKLRQEEETTTESE